MTGTIEQRVRAEIEALHEFFVGWFSGALGADSFESGFSSRFDPDCLLIPPAGVILAMPELTEMIRGAHDTNPAPGDRQSGAGDLRGMAA